MRRDRKRRGERRGLRSQDRTVRLRVCNQQNDPIDVPVALLQGDSTRETLNVAEPRLCLHGDRTPGTRNQGIPGALVTGEGERHFCPPPQGRWKQGSKALEEGEMSRIAKRIATGVGANRQIEPDNRSHAYKIGEGYASEPRSFDAAHLRVRHPGCSTDLGLGEAGRKSGPSDLCSGIQQRPVEVSHRFIEPALKRRHVRIVAAPNKRPCIQACMPPRAYRGSSTPAALPEAKPGAGPPLASPRSGMPLLYADGAPRLHSSSDQPIRHRISISCTPGVKRRGPLARRLLSAGHVPAAYPPATAPSRTSIAWSSRWSVRS